MQAVSRHEHGLAINMALHLGEQDVLKKAIDSVEIDAIALVVRSIDPQMLKALMKFIAGELVRNTHDNNNNKIGPYLNYCMALHCNPQAVSRHVEYYLKWCWALLTTFGKLLHGAHSMSHQESFRALIRAISIHESEIMRMCDENYFNLSFLASHCGAALSEVDVEVPVTAGVTPNGAGDSSEALRTDDAFGVSKPSSKEGESGDGDSSSEVDSNVDEACDIVEALIDRAPQAEAEEAAEILSPDAKKLKKRKSSKLKSIPDSVSKVEKGDAVDENTEKEPQKKSKKLRVSKAPEVVVPMQASDKKTKLKKSMK